MIVQPRYRGPFLPTTLAVSMTAAASGSNGITVADDNDIDAGTGDFFLHWEGSLPDWTPATSVNYLYYHYADANNRIGLYVNSSGNLVFIAIIGGVRVCAETSATTISTSSASISGTGGAIYKISCKFARETASAAGAISYLVNGAQLGTSIAVSAATPPSFTITGSAYVSGTNAVRLASNTIACIVGNFAPTAAEVLDLCTNGIPESWKWGSQAASYTSNFSAGVDGFTATGGTAAGNIDSIGGQDDWLRLTVNSANTTHRLIKTGLFVTGYKYLVSGLMYVPSTNSNLDGAAFGDTSNSSAITTVYAPALDTVVPWYGYFTAGSTDFRVAATDGGNGTFQDAGGDDVLYIKSVSVVRVGATLALLPNSIPTSGATAWDDSSGNTGGGTLPAAGASKVTIRK